MHDTTAYTVLITYQVGTGYAAEPLTQLILTLAAYDEAGAREDTRKVLALNPAIERYLINVLPGDAQVK